MLERMQRYMSGFCLLFIYWHQPPDIYCTVASAPTVYIRIFNLFSGQCGLITIVMQNLIIKIPSQHSWIDCCCCCCLVINNSVSVSDPDPDSGVFWIRIQGLKKRSKMLHNHDIIELFSDFYNIYLLIDFF